MYKNFFLCSFHCLEAVAMPSTPPPPSALLDGLLGQWEASQLLFHYQEQGEVYWHQMRRLEWCKLIWIALISGNLLLATKKWLSIKKNFYLAAFHFWSIWDNFKINFNNTLQLLYWLPNKIKKSYKNPSIFKVSPQNT